MVRDVWLLLMVGSILNHIYIHIHYRWNARGHPRNCNLRKAVLLVFHIGAALGASLGAALGAVVFYIGAVGLIFWG